MKNLTYKAVENSKNTSGESGNNPAGGSGQLTQAQITELVGLAASMGATHFQNLFFMDTNTQMQANYSAYSSNYNLRTLEADTQLWADICHAAGLKVVYRGSWSGIKGNNNFAFVKYGTGTFVPVGTPASAASEGETTYCGKMYRFLNTNIGVSHLANGDIIAPISEFTEFLSNANYTWFDTSGGVQAGIYDFFTKMKQVVDNFATANNLTLGFWSIVNYSEYLSGYLNNTLPAAQGIIPIDYYGHSGGYSNGVHVSPANYVTDWLAVRTQVGGAGYPLHQTELGGIFGDSWPSLNGGDIFSPKITTYEDSAHYQIRLYKAYRDSLVDPGYMSGVSQWGFWSGQNSSIVFYTGGHYYLNYFGQLYSAFIKGNGIRRIPVPRVTSGILDSWGNRSVYF